MKRRTTSKQAPRLKKIVRHERGVNIDPEHYRRMRIVARDERTTVMFVLDSILTEWFQIHSEYARKEDE